MAITSPITEYAPNWPLMFEAEKSNIEDRLSCLILAIHHIGSTAIVGMKAKPEIDILIVVKSVADIKKINAGMSALGYRCRGEGLEQGGTPGRFYYSKDVGGKRTHKAHVCQVGHNEILRKLVFRDYLRDHPDEADKYGKLKKVLETSNKSGMAEYLAGKQGYIEEIITLALHEGYGKEANKELKAAE